ncbi:hypothetical protein R6Q57_024397 [Mikania cordata]
MSSAPAFDKTVAFSGLQQAEDPALIHGGKFMFSHGLGGPSSMDGFTFADEIGLNPAPLGPGGVGGVNCELAATTELNSCQPPSQDGVMDALVDTASLRLGMNGSESGKKRSPERSDDRFRFLVKSVL